MVALLGRHIMSRGMSVAQTFKRVHAVSGSMFAGGGSIVAGRESMAVAVRGSRFVGGGSWFTVRGWRFAGRSSRSRRSDATLSSRGTSVT
jgi:hypothetical protein